MGKQWYILRLDELLCTISPKERKYNFDGIKITTCTAHGINENMHIIRN